MDGWAGLLKLSDQITTLVGTNNYESGCVWNINQYIIIGKSIRAINILLHAVQWRKSS